MKDNELVHSWDDRRLEVYPARIVNHVEHQCVREKQGVHTKSEYNLCDAENRVRNQKTHRCHVMNKDCSLVLHDVLCEVVFMLEAGFEPARLAPKGLKSSPLVHSGIPATFYVISSLSVYKDTD